ncbi:hypothetical protein MM809_37665, partial [Klebsiella pneumoniae]|nr:hypothetical protein [Klebsiella pneumoniae]
TDEIPWFLAILIRYALPLSLGTKSSAAKTAADTVKKTADHFNNFLNMVGFPAFGIRLKIRATV